MAPGCLVLMPRLCAICYPIYWTQLWGDAAWVWIYLSLCATRASYLTSFWALSFPILAMDKKSIFLRVARNKRWCSGTPHSIHMIRNSGSRTTVFLPGPPQVLMWGWENTSSFLSLLLCPGGSQTVVSILKKILLVFKNQIKRYPSSGILSFFLPPTEMQAFPWVCLDVFISYSLDHPSYTCKTYKPTFQTLLQELRHLLKL